MRKSSILFSIVSLAGALCLASTADAQMIDKAGKCHAADGKLAKMEVCKPPAKSGPCKDEKTGKFISCAAAKPKGPCKDPKTGQFMACAAAKPAATPAKATAAPKKK
jgi:hypothetical protein